MSLLESKNTLSRLADEYVQVLKEMVDVLELEQSNLKNRKFDNMNSCTGEKETLLTRLAQLDAQRHSLTGDSTAQAKKEVDSRTSKVIESLLEKCRDLNIVNGGIVEISKQFNRRMLDTILGAASEDNKLYDATGNNSGNRLQQVFAKI